MVHSSVPFVSFGPEIGMDCNPSASSFLHLTSLSLSFVRIRKGLFITQPFSFTNFKPEMMGLDRIRSMLTILRGFPFLLLT